MNHSPASYTSLWTNDRCKALEARGEVGRNLEVLFGGPHQSLPSMTRFGVRPGDYVYPVRVLKGTLYIIARMRVKRFISVEEYCREYLKLPKEHLGLSFWALEALLAKERPELGHRLPHGCIDEVAIGESGTEISLDMAVPGSLLAEIRFCSRRGERPIKHVENGKLKSAASIQGGVYCLSPHSAIELENLLRGVDRATPV